MVMLSPIARWLAVIKLSFWKHLQSDQPAARPVFCACCLIWPDRPFIAAGSRYCVSITRISIPFLIFLGPGTASSSCSPFDSASSKFLDRGPCGCFSLFSLPPFSTYFVFLLSFGGHIPAGHPSFDLQLIYRRPKAPGASSSLFV